MRFLKRTLLISALLIVLFMISLVITSLWFVFIYGPEHVNWSCSTVVLARDGTLLGATTARDGMWRFPPLRDSIPHKIEIATLVQEDKRFYWHLGVDPIAIMRAIYVNMKAGRIKQGGSTITMQLARILMGNKPRTFYQKLKEILLAIGLELKYSKKEILLWHLSLAPYGGNIVGVEAASWRYFGKPPNHLTWAESATLAVLPHSPSLINLRKNRELLEEKRNRLLYRLFKNGYIDSNEYALSIKEPIPVYKHQLPTHLIQIFHKLREMVATQTKIITTINPIVQKKVEDIVWTYYQTNLLPSDVHNIAVVVVDLRSGEVVAAVPNVPLDISQTSPSQWVDMLHAERNPGSVLKPVLYAAALTDGIIMPSCILPDYPISIAGYAPRNFSGGFRGAIPAWKALAHSLNIPAVVLLHRYGIEKYHFVLRKLGLSSIRHPPSHYGLSMILGTFEVSLWNLVSLYYSLVKYMEQSYSTGKEPVYVFKEPCLVLPCETEGLNGAKTWREATSYISPAAIWITLRMLLKAERPDQEVGWQFWESDFPVAWKTGTSSGLRDAWAIGITPNYIVGVWVGNANGEGKPDLTGISKAAPIMFDILRSLKNPREWFAKPVLWLKEVEICSKSGFLASSECPHTKREDVPIGNVAFPLCMFHKKVFLTNDLKWRVYRNCYSGKIIDTVWYDLPPAMVEFYRKWDLSYEDPPPFHPRCKQEGLAQENPIAIISSSNNHPIFIPKNKKAAEIVIRAVHRYTNSKLHWFLNDTYLGMTTHPTHSMSIKPDTGKHTLFLVDEQGNSLTYIIRIIDKPGKLIQEIN